MTTGPSARGLPRQDASFLTAWKKAAAPTAAFPNAAAPTGASARSPRGMMPGDPEAGGNEGWTTTFSPTARTISDFTTSRHYLAGLFHTQLLASVCRTLAAGPRKTALKEAGTVSRAGVATGFGTMNEHDFITIGERHGWGGPLPFWHFYR